MRFWWVPCWAGMPEEYGGQSPDVLVTVTDGEWRKVQTAWTINGTWANILSNHKVVAWAYLPEPWGKMK